MLSRTIRRRDTGTPPALPEDLHPLLRRLYANRGVCEPADLDLGLARLVQQKAQLGTIWSLIVNDHSFKHGYLLCRIIDNVRQYIAIGRFSHSLVRPRIRKARQRAHALGSQHTRRCEQHAHAQPATRGLSWQSANSRNKPVKAHLPHLRKGSPLTCSYAFDYASSATARSTMAAQ